MKSRQDAFRHYQKSKAKLIANKDLELRRDPILSRIEEELALQLGTPMGQPPKRLST